MLGRDEGLQNRSATPIFRPAPTKHFFKIFRGTILCHAARLEDRGVHSVRELAGTIRVGADYYRKACKGDCPCVSYLCPALWLP